MRRRLIFLAVLCCLNIGGNVRTAAAEVESTQAAEITEGSGDTDLPTGEEGPAEEVVKLPGKIKNLNTTCLSRKKVKLTWDADENAIKYVIYRKTGSGSYKTLAETQKTSYTDKTVSWNKSYTYKVVGFEEHDLKGEAATVSYKPTQIVNITSKKYTYAKMKKQLKALQSLYSGRCTLKSIGKSVQGRNIYDLAIGDPNAAKSLLVVSTLHAREYIASTVVMRQAEYYLQNYDTDVFSKIQVHYIVMANPDGVTLSQTKSARWKSNANGVDLNRNFPNDDFVVGGTKGSEGYSGKKALSEPESRAVAELTSNLKENQNLVGVINYHAMGRIIYNSCSSKKLKSDVNTMYTIAKKLTGYSAAPESVSSGKSPGGQYRDYVMYTIGVPSITIEVGSTSAPCAYSEYYTEYLKNKQVVYQIAKALVK